jgi:transposase-like protein
MAQDDEPLSGEVEADETHLGRIAAPGRGREVPQAGRDRPEWCGWALEGSQQGDRVRGGRARRARARRRGGQQASRDLLPQVVKYVLPESTIFTDEWPSYNALGVHYRHHRIRHTEKVYVSGDVHTQTIEGFFSNLKRGIAGTYHSVSSRWLQSYLNEYTFRYCERDNPRAMFATLVDRAAA